jgi:hypothetical protein
VEAFHAGAGGLSVVQSDVGDSALQADFLGFVAAVIRHCPIASGDAIHGIGQTMAQKI